MPESLQGADVLRATSTGFTYSFFETPISGYVFTGWGGACSNYGSNPICNVEITASTTIIANFAPTVANYTLTVAETGSGIGTVTSNSSASPVISCAINNENVTGTCSENDASGTPVTLTAIPSAGSVFTGWGGACSGISLQCIVTMSQSQNVFATFSVESFGNINTCAGGVAAGCIARTFAVSLNVPTSATVSSTNVMTQGVSNLDFTLGVGSGCTGFVGPGICVVNVDFAPIAPGLRLGAVQLLDSGGNVLATQLISGVGQGPAVAFGPGTQTTVPGTGLSQPYGLAVDAAGDVFFGEPGANKVFEVTPGGVQTSIGTITGHPYGLAVDGVGDVFVAELNNNQIVKVTPSGVQTTVPATGLTQPIAVAVDGVGDLFISDRNNNRVVELTPGGVQTTVPTTGLNQPYGLAVDAAGNVFIADYNNNRVIEVTPSGVQTTVPTTGLTQPYGVAVDAADDVFIVSYVNERVIEVTPSGVQTTVAASGLNGPSGVALDGAGDIFISDYNNNRVVEMNRSQPPSLSFASTNVGSTSTDSPQSVTLQNIGNQHMTGSVSLTSGQNFAIGPSSSCGGFDMFPGESCTENFDFAPETAGNPLTTTAVFSDNALNGAPATQTVNLSGTGVAVGPIYALTVADIGSGSGTVTDNSQITCTETNGSITVSSCSGSYASGTGVTLNANATGTSVFLGWGGACASAGTSPTCSVTMNAAENVTASFSQQSFGNVSVCPGGNVAGCTGTSPSLTVTFNLAATTNIGAIQVVTQGVTGLDFTLGSGGTCASIGTVSAGNSCNVNVNFTPLAPGLRAGAVELYNTNGNLVATTPIYGIGQAPAAAFNQATQIAVNTTSSPLNQAKGLVVDAAGDVFIADTGNHRVVEVAANGTQTTVGTGWMQPQGLALDGAGNLYVADNNLNEVVEVPAGCTSSTCQKVLMNEETPVSGTTLPVRAELGVAVDGAGNVFVGDFVDGEVVEIPANGSTPTVVYNPAGANPVGLGVDAAGDLFIADHGLKQVAEVPAGCGNSSCWKTIGSGWQQPDSVSVDAAGDVYVADEGPTNSTVLGVVDEVLPPTCTSNCQIVLASGLNTVVATSDATGDVFISNQGNNQVVELTRSQPPSLSFALTNLGIASADSPQAVSVQNVGNLPLTGSVGATSTTNFAENNASTCTTFTLAAGAICSESFSFTPQTTGDSHRCGDFQRQHSEPFFFRCRADGQPQRHRQRERPDWSPLVPNVVGMTEAAAATTLTGCGLDAGDREHCVQQQRACRQCDRRKPGRRNAGQSRIRGRVCSFPPARRHRPRQTRSPSRITTSSPVTMPRRE